jgi:hypothetical protein
MVSQLPDNCEMNIIVSIDPHCQIEIWNVVKINKIKVLALILVIKEKNLLSRIKCLLFSTWMHGFIYGV